MLASSFLLHLSLTCTCIHVHVRVFPLQLFREAKRVVPSIFYLPRIDTWWDVTTETFQSTLTSSLISLPPSTSLIVVATAECTWQELSPSLKQLFSSVSEAEGVSASMTFDPICAALYCTCIVCCVVHGEVHVHVHVYMYCVALPCLFV